MTIKAKKIGIIGAGVMGQSLIKGLLQSGKVSKKDIWCSVKSELSQKKLSKDLDVPVLLDFTDQVSSTDIFIICTKPRYVTGVLDDIANAGKMKSSALLISIAAGLPISKMQEHLVQKVGLIRAMPNTPCKINSGITVIAKAQQTTNSQMEMAKTIFESVGLCIQLDESHMDAVTAVSGSGPAYIFLMMEALADGAVRVGLPRDVAFQLVSQTMLGSAKMLQQSGKHPAALKDEVTTPAGCTIAGLLIMEDGKIRSTLARAVEEATKVSKGLGN